MELVVELKGGKKTIEYKWYRMKYGQNKFEFVGTGEGTNNTNKLKVNVKNVPYDYRCVMVSKDNKVLSTIPVRVEKR